MSGLCGVCCVANIVAELPTLDTGKSPATERTNCGQTLTHFPQGFLMSRKGHFSRQIRRAVRSRKREFFVYFFARRRRRAKKWIFLVYARSAPALWERARGESETGTRHYEHSEAPWPSIPLPPFPQRRRWGKGGSEVGITSVRLPSFPHRAGIDRET